MKIIFTADIHIKRTVWSHHPEIEGDALEALCQIKDLALSLKQDDDVALIIGGDLFNATRSTADLVQAATNMLLDLTVNGIKVYAIQGNHDRDKIPWTDLASVEHMHGQGAIKIGNHFFTGFDYMPLSDIQGALAAVPAQTEVLVCHQALKEALTFENAVGQGVWNLESEWIPSWVKLVLAGDIHHPNTYDLPGGGKLIYPGTPWMWRINEVHRKTVVVLDDDLNIERMPIKARPFTCFNISDQEGLDVLVKAVNKHKPDETIPEQIRKPVYRVLYSTQIPQVVGVLADLVKLDKVHILQEPVAVAQSDSEESSPTHSGISMIDCLPEAVDRDKDPRLFSFLHDLLEADQPAVYLTDELKKAEGRSI